MSRRYYLTLTPYELHKRLINNYVLCRKGATSLLQRDTSRDKKDIDVIRENHKFLWEEDDVPTTWEEKLAKKYYDKLFKEFCITDLSRYKENKFAMRWQTAQELICGKGQFICGALNCVKREGLRSWEVNFGYIEHGEKRNALVKIRLCKKCSTKLNYHHKRKEVKRGKKKRHRLMYDEVKSDTDEEASESELPTEDPQETQEKEKSDEANAEEESSNFWKGPGEVVEEATREDEFEEYLNHLLA